MAPRYKMNGISYRPQRGSQQTSEENVRRHDRLLLRRICSRTFSVRLRPSPSVPVRSPPFYHILSYYPILLRLLSSHPCPCYVSVIPSHPFQLSTLGSDPFSVSSDLALYYFRYCSAITPISPTPSHPVFYYLLFLIVL